MDKTWLCWTFTLVLTLAESREQCYERLGCFSLDSPWTSLLRPVPAPQSPEDINTQLFGYTRDSPQAYNIQLWPEISLGGCPFQADRTTVFIAHGLLGSGDNAWLNEMKNAYLDTVDANVYIVDWGGGSKTINYYQAAANTRVVAEEILRFINYLQTEYGLEASNVHLIGHSMGAQISSYIGKGLPGTERITALDPAQPMFEGFDKEVRLDKSDANFVEVMHTNAVPTIPYLGLGYIFPAGDVDFYINGGQRQPLCETSDLTTHVSTYQNLGHFTWEALTSVSSCSHNRAPKYFIDVLRSNCSLWGRKASPSRTALLTGAYSVPNTMSPITANCDANSCIPLGLDTPQYTARGVFVVQTPINAPFCEDPKVNAKILSEMSQTSNENNNSETNKVTATTSETQLPNNTVNTTSSSTTSEDNLS